MSEPGNNTYLRHILATIYYRFQKSTMYADEDFGRFSAGNGSRSPVEIVHHMHRVLLFATSMVRTESTGDQTPEHLDFAGEEERFLQQLKKLDEEFQRQEITLEMAKRLLQGPLSDVLTHIGQIAMLSRLYGRPIEREDFSIAPVLRDFLQA